VIDDRIPKPWPQSVFDATRLFRQGDVVESPPFFYFRDNDHHIWQVQVDDDGTDDMVFELDPDDAPPFGLITTQTCDLVEEGTPKQPWFAVVPVYDYTAKLKGGQEVQLRRGEFQHLVLLTATWLPAGCWIADLRIEMPIEKGWLVGQEQRSGFSTLNELRVLATRLASRRNRPALSAELTQQLIGPLREWVRTDGKAYRDEVESLRILVPGDTTVARVGKLIVVVKSGALSTAAAKAWSEFEATLIDEAAKNDVVAQPFRYATYDELTGREVEVSERLDFDFLSPTD